MAPRPSQPILASLVCVAFVLAVMVAVAVLGGCARAPMPWPHFGDPWPVDEPLHDDQPALCPDSCTI